MTRREPGWKLELPRLGFPSKSLGTSENEFSRLCPVLSSGDESSHAHSPPPPALARIMGGGYRSRLGGDVRPLYEC